MESDQDYDHLDVFASNLKVETALNSSYGSEADDSGGDQLELEILTNLDALKQQTKQLFQESRAYKTILKEKDDKIKVLMDLNLTLQLENRELKQKLSGNTSNCDSPPNKTNSMDFQEFDDSSQISDRADSPAKVFQLLNKKQLFNLSVIDLAEAHDSKYIQKILFSLYTQEEINGISVSGKPTKNPKYHTANQTACKPISIAKLHYIYYMMDERVEKSGSTGRDELRRKSRQLINKFINRAIQFVKRTRKKRDERNQPVVN